jgi:hypothetical protein
LAEEAMRAGVNLRLEKKWSAADEIDQVIIAGTSGTQLLFSASPLAFR